MADIDKDLQELKKEVIEARNLVIKTDNLLKGLHTEVKGVAEKQKSFERKSFVSTATAYIMMGALAALGAYMFARGGLKAKDQQLKIANGELAAKKKALASQGALEVATKDESARSLALFQQLAGSDADQRNRALAEVASLKPEHLTKLEVLALQDKAQSLRQEAADDALQAGKQAFNRHDYRSCADALGRYVTLAIGAPDPGALFDLGQARHELKDFKGAVDPLTRYLKAVPGSKSGDYATMLLGESLAKSGDTQKAIDVYRAGSQRYSASQSAPWMRARAHRLEQQLKDEKTAASSAAPTAASSTAPTAAKAGSDAPKPR